MTGRSKPAHVLWYTGPGAAEIREEPLPASDGADLLVAAGFGAVSRGTERLVFRGEVPESEAIRMRCPFQRGGFPFPTAYGYCLVGRVIEGPAAWLGKEGFVLHPHATYARIPADWFAPLPEGLPPRRAVLAANTETALNAIWDADLGPGDRVAVVGAGLVGGLVAHLAARIPGTEVLIVDPDPSRATLAAAIGARYAPPGQAEGDHDVIFHASARAAGLDAAIALAGFEATIVEMSWYGSAPVTASFGGAFHSRRLRLLSSQVGAVPATRRARWTPRRRLETALRLLLDPAMDAHLGDEVRFFDLPSSLSDILAGGGGCPVVRY